ncbi:MAG: response regulator [Syntrophaceae bacterium]|nr:response regulator [Syntrophaceae bacterium]
MNPGRLFALTISFIFLIMLLDCGKNNPIKDPPVAQNGLMDLRGWDFIHDGPVDLNGEWKFIWMEDSASYQLPEYDDGAWEAVPVPSSWIDYGREKYGYSWYRLKILLDPRMDLGIYLNAARTAYTMYIDGQLFLNNGKAGNSESETQPQQKPSINYLPESTELVIAWKISNYHLGFSGGGPSYAPRVSLTEDLFYSLWLTDFLSIIILGIILMMTLYHVLLWAGRREDRSSLLFAIFCLLIFLRMLGTGVFLHRLFPGAGIYQIRLKMEIVAITLGWPVFTAFLSQLFPVEFKNKIYRVFQLAGFILTVFVLVTHTRTISDAVVFINLVLLLVVGWSFFSIVKTVLKKRSESLLVLCGCIFLLLTIINDVLFSFALIPTAYIFPIGLVIFIFFMSAVLSTRFAKTYKTANHLSINLQQEVEKQTKIITDKNQELVRLNQERTDYFINLAHETKTPLTLISNYLKKYIQKQGMDQDLSIISKNIEKMKQDMISFLDYEKLEKGQEFYDHGNISDFSRILANSVQLFTETAAQKQIEITTDIKKKILVMADPYAIDRIIYNLLDNALKYTNPGGCISIALSAAAKEVSFSVTDTGIGISEEQQKSIFKSYYQITHEKRNIQGIGMGLNIVRRIVDDLGGSIEVASTPGKGSAFIVRLNRLDGEPGSGKNALAADTVNQFQPREDTKIPVVNIPDSRRSNLLIIEDNPDMLAYLCDALGDDYNVYGARNGRQALDILENKPGIQLVISDVMMDVMDGYTFYDELKKDERYESLPVIFLTAKSIQKERIDALKRGVVDYICKPFDIEELKAKIHSIIHITESQFERTKQALIRQIVNTSKNRLHEADFSCQFDIKCRESNLSEREKEIVLLLFDGRQNKEIAHTLAISINTVKTHITSIYKKCGAQNKIELMNAFKIT